MTKNLNWDSLKEWIIFNKLENFNSILNYLIDDFTPSGNLCYMNVHGDILPYTPMIQISNLRWCIQHLMDESEEEKHKPLIRQNWMKQTNSKFMKYVIHHRHPMTPQQLKEKSFEEIFKKQNENLDMEEGESNKEEDKSTTSSEKSEQDSESDTSTEDEQETNTTEINQIHNIHNGLNNTIHDEENTSEAEHDTLQKNENMNEM